MTKEIEINEIKLKYELIRKKVKNINLRINSAGNITVSANNNVSIEFIEELLKTKSEFIFNALRKIQVKASVKPIQNFTEDELSKYVIEYSNIIYPYYKEITSINFPVIKFRKMKSRWGSCCPSKGILTFNKNLIFVSKECINYVIIHEFTHFIHPNHSPLFYEELSKICPDWKNLKKQLQQIYIPDL